MYIKYINLQEVKSHQKFCESIRLLQRFFNKNSNEMFRVNKETFKGLYKILFTFISKSNNFDMFYICDKLVIKKNSKLPEIIDELTKRVKVYKEKNLFGRELDYINRVILILMKDNNFKLLQNDVVDLLGGIIGLIKIYNTQILLKKYAIDFIDEF